MTRLDPGSVLRVTENLIEESNGTMVALPAGDYRALPVGGCSGTDTDQFLLVAQGRERAHAVTGEMLAALAGDKRIQVMCTS